MVLFINCDAKVKSTFRPIVPPYSNRERKRLGYEIEYIELLLLTPPNKSDAKLFGS
jgi:hypothetical protein